VEEIAFFLLEKINLLDKIDHVSTGGGAMLKFFNLGL